MTEPTSWKQIACALSDRFRIQDRRHTQQTQTPEGFGYIPINLITFLNLINLAKSNLGSKRSTYTTKFIDAGCGIGLTLDFAKDMGFQTFGVEHTPELAAEARSRGHEVFDGDIKTFDFRPYDIVYSYMPLKDEAWTKFLFKVSSEAKVGTILISAMGRWLVAPDAKDQWEVLKDVRPVKPFENLLALEEGYIIKKIK